MALAVSLCRWQSSQHAALHGGCLRQRRSSAHAIGNSAAPRCESRWEGLAATADRGLAGLLLAGTQHQLAVGIPDGGGALPAGVQHLLCCSRYAYGEERSARELEDSAFCAYALDGLAPRAGSLAIEACFPWHQALQSFWCRPGADLGTCAAFRRFGFRPASAAGWLGWARQTPTPKPHA